MQVFRNLEEVPSDFGPTVVSVGNFDGVHRAHQEVVRRMAERAHALGGKAVVVTFEPHPLRILRPDVAPKLLTPLPIKLRLLQQTRVDAVLVLPFTRDLSLMTADDFAKTGAGRSAARARGARGLQLPLRPKAQGNVNTLADLGKEFGFDGDHLSRAGAARASRLQQRDPQADRRRKNGEGARAAGTALQHLLESRARTRLWAQIHRADGEPGALRRTGSRRSGCTSRGCASAANVSRR